MRPKLLLRISALEGAGKNLTRPLIYRIIVEPDGTASARYLRTNGGLVLIEGEPAIEEKGASSRYRRTELE